jgi:hypothetical protein
MAMFTFAAIVQLRHMDLSNTSVSGELPIDWPQTASSLISVNVTNTDVSGPLPLSWLAPAAPSGRLSLGLPSGNPDSPVCLPAPLQAPTVALLPAVPPPCNLFSSWTVHLPPPVACKLASVCPGPSERIQPLTERLENATAKDAAMPSVHFLECHARMQPECLNASQPDDPTVTVATLQPASMPLEELANGLTSGNAVVSAASRQQQKAGASARGRRMLRDHLLGAPARIGLKDGDGVWVSAVGSGRRQLREEENSDDDKSADEEYQVELDEESEEDSPEESAKSDDLPAQLPSPYSEAPAAAPTQQAAPGPQSSSAAPAGGDPPLNSPAMAPAKTAPPVVTFSTTGAEATTALGHFVLLALFSDVLTPADVHGARIEFAQRTQATPASPSSPADPPSPELSSRITIPASGDTVPSNNGSSLSKQAIIVISTLGSIAAALALALLAWYCCGGRARTSRQKPGPTDSSGASLHAGLHCDDSINTTADTSKCLHPKAPDSETRGSSPGVNRKLGFILQQQQRGVLIRSPSRGSVADVASASTTPHRSFHDPDTGPGSSVALGINGASELEFAAAGSRVFFDVGGSSNSFTNTNNSQTLCAGELPGATEYDASPGRWKLDSARGSALGDLQSIIYEDQEEGQGSGASNEWMASRDDQDAEAGGVGDLQRTQTVAVVELSDMSRRANAESQPVLVTGKAYVPPSVIMRSDATWRGSHAPDSVERAPLDISGVRSCTSLVFVPCWNLPCIF